jgi:hypothetical protein
MWGRLCVCCISLKGMGVIVLLMMGTLVPETCWGNKAAYLVVSIWFFTFHYVYDARLHEHSRTELWSVLYFLYDDHLPNGDPSRSQTLYINLMFVVPYILVTYFIQIQLDVQYSFFLKSCLLNMFRMSHTSIISSTTVVYSHRVFIILVCLFHGAGTGVGTVCHYSTVSFSLVCLIHGAGTGVGTVCQL